MWCRSLSLNDIAFYRVLAQGEYKCVITQEGIPYAKLEEEFFVPFVENT
jgi:hypothetical protein